MRTILAISGGMILTISVIIGGYYFLQYQSFILKVIQQFAIGLRSNKYGPFILSALVALTSTPPIFGFTFMVMLNGFVYGFPLGLLPSVTGAFVGSMICFCLIRGFHMDRYIPMPKSQEKKYQAMQEAIKEGGLKMIVLLRICPIPWQFTNMFLSLIPTVRTKDYIITGLIGSWKVSMEVWAGSQLSNLSDNNLPPSTRRFTLITLFFGLIVFAGLIHWIYQLTNQKMNKLKG
ncbi:unnamed protein product [Cunninghamella blakesleeana]